ncbi:hypothetical protein [Paraliomyxa miuraensis]|uniref:hypothetical protein n=1 Tax=Paraliomyxa miuraensis TaxID=376150 RepID=UPI0022567427|nr:hypothetical protein [Paraliomyxa miuraensis]MCX4247531.1 hypothetical protein [Paraliomyxa miuraensis]
MTDLDTLGTLLVVSVVVIAVAQRQRLAEILLRHEDGRTLAALRIIGGGLVLWYVAARAPLHPYLLSDEGLFLEDTAQWVFARDGFGGYGQDLPGSAAGFFDLRGVLAWVLGPNHSLLMFRSDPAFVRAHELALYVVAGAFTVGLATPITKWLTWFLLLSILQRNTIAAAGEQVLLGFLVPVVWSRCGEVWSVDRWLRRARPERRIPAWPRYLMIVQTLPMFAANGLYKTGQMWADGDTLWYTLSHPGLRTEWASVLPSALGPVPLRLATWFVHGFEVLFPLAIAGAVARALVGTSRPSPAARLVTRGAALVFAAALVATALALLDPNERGRLPMVAVVVHAGWIAVLAIGWPTIPPAWRPWIVGRRVWIPAIACFTIPLVLLLDIGAFTAMTAASCLAFVRGDELGRLLRRIGSRVGARPPEPVDPPARPGWRRRAVLVLVAMHVAMIGVARLPPSESELRATLAGPLEKWSRLWGTGQHWRMFAPNGPVRVEDVRVQASLADGRVVDLGRGLHAEAGFDAGSEPASAHDKAGKVARRLAGGGPSKWFRKWHVRYVCRAWALHHEGQPPLEVELFSVSEPIAAPPDRRPFTSPTSVEKSLEHHVCAETPQGQLPGEVLQRYGIDPATAPPFVPWDQGRREKWIGRSRRGS